MKNLVIVSRHWDVYKSRFETNSGLKKLYRLVDAGKTLKSAAALKEAEVMIGEPDLTANVIDSCRNLKWLQSTWAGNNKLQAIQKQDYILTGVKGVFGLQMVEYVLSYLLYFTRRIEDFNSLKQSHIWSQLPCKPLSDYTIGIIGFGSIGQELAQRLLQFSMTVIGLSRSKKTIQNIDQYTYQELPEFLSQCDFVVCLLPETNETKGMCNQEFFSQMKKGSVFINAGRGSVVESPANLVEALESNWLKAAVLDVFHEEPLPADHAYYSSKNLYISCHTAAISNPNEVFDIFELNALRYAKGQPLLYVHDFKEGY